MNKEPQNHELDLDNNEALDLFAEELPAQDQKHNLAAPMLSDTLSTLACECEHRNAADERTEIQRFHDCFLPR